jgi:hypothetical protein
MRPRAASQLYEQATGLEGANGRMAAVQDVGTLLESRTFSSEELSPEFITRRRSA